jgi:hypothetical protein
MVRHRGRRDAGKGKMQVGSLRNRSAPYSGSARGLRKAWQGVRNCEAVSTNLSVRLSAAHIPTPRLGTAVAGLRNQSTPYSGSARDRRRAWQSVRNCAAVSTNPAVRLSAAHILPPRLLREVATWSEQNAPRPEHAKRAIWAGRAARSRAAASTDRGWASNSGSPSLDPEFHGRLEKPQVG